ncbi:uncharacterized protein LOC134802815 [Cydia splendana]|uniref:uncharacterized protein LOC134802815 n=1 Tax=Cydia splendana TaxID=1100963 RepID=UPI0028F4A7E7
MLRAVVILSLCSISWTQRAERTLDMIIAFVEGTLRDIELEYNRTDPIVQNSHHTPAYEVGYLLRTMEECYRRMVDIYNSTITTDLYNLDAFTTDHIMFLKHIENFYWLVYNLEHMLHEIEKKYMLKRAGMFEHYDDFTTRPQPTTKRHRFRPQAVVSMTTTTKRPKQTWWARDYGWDQMDEW